MGKLNLMRGLRLYAENVSDAFRKSGSQLLKHHVSKVFKFDTNFPRNELEQPQARHGNKERKSSQIDVREEEMRGKCKTHEYQTRRWKIGDTKVIPAVA